MMSGAPWEDFAPKAAPAQSAPAQAPASMPWDDFKPPTQSPAKEWGFREYATEGLRAIGTGASKAVTSTAGLPADILRLGQAGLDYSQSVGQGRPFADVSAENQAAAPGVSRALQAAGSENLQSFVPISPPETRVGKLAAEGIHFAGQAAALPFGGASALGRAVGAGGAVAGVASEAAGQLTQGTAAEPYARLAGALVPTGVSAIAQAPSAAQRAAVGAAREIPQAELNQILDGAQRLIDDAAANGTKLSTFQAVDQASGGRLNLSELQRHAEGMGRLRSFFADIGDRNRDAAGRQFRGVAPDRADVSAVGAEVGAAARAGVAATPEGQALARSQRALGPRVEAREAGEAMQTGLMQTEAERRAARSAVADPLYDDARNAPDNFAVQGQPLPPEVDPVARQMSGISEAPETIRAPARTGQIDPTSALAHIDEAITNAKGDQLTALRKARRTLFDADGNLDLTADGNMNASRAIQSIADKAAAQGDNNTARLMGDARAALGEAMEVTPEIATANAEFARMSRPLDAFDASRPAGKIVSRDRASGRPDLDPEFVPDQIRGSTGAREFNEAAPPAARQAFQGRLTTEITDAAGGEAATGEAIRAQITQNYDRLRDQPEVLARLNARAEADEGLAAVRASPLGQLAERNPTTKEAVNALFQRGEAAQSVSSQEVGRAVSALVATNPRAAAQLVRIKIEGAFNSVAKDVNTAGGQMGAAKFRNALMGNTKEAADLRAAVRALPDGETVMAGLDRLFDVFQAQGLRQNVGSKTAYNQLFIEEASKGGNIEGVAKAAVNPIKLPSRFGKMIEEWRLGRNMDQIAAMATDPNARAAFRGLLKSGDISGPVGRLATIAARSQSSPALQIRVQPRTED